MTSTTATNTTEAMQVPNASTLTLSRITGETLLAILGLVPGIEGNGWDITELARQCKYQGGASVTLERRRLQNSLKTTIRHKYGEGVYECLDPQNAIAKQEGFDTQFVLASAIVASEHVDRVHGGWLQSVLDANEIEEWSAWLFPARAIPQLVESSLARFGSLRDVETAQYSSAAAAQTPGDNTSAARTLGSVIGAGQTSAVQEDDEAAVDQDDQLPGDQDDGTPNNQENEAAEDQDDVAAVDQDVKAAENHDFDAAEDQDLGNQDVVMQDDDEAAHQEDGVVADDDNGDDDESPPLSFNEDGKVDELPAGTDLLKCLGIWPFTEYNEVYTMSRIAAMCIDGEVEEAAGHTQRSLVNLLLRSRDRALNEAFGAGFAKRWISQRNVAKKHGYDLRWAWAASATLQGVDVPADLETKICKDNQIPDLGIAWAQGKMFGQ